MKKAPDKQALSCRAGSFLRSRWQYLGLIYQAPSRQHDANTHQVGVSHKLKQETSPCSPRRPSHWLSCSLPLQAHWPQRSSRASSPVTTDRKSTRLNSSHGYISYAVFCLKKKKLINPVTGPSLTRVQLPVLT